jgi:hypothetical protein
VADIEKREHIIPPKNKINLALPCIEYKYNREVLLVLFTTKVLDKNMYLGVNIVKESKKNYCKHYKQNDDYDIIPKVDKPGGVFLIPLLHCLGFERPSLVLLLRHVSRCTTQTPFAEERKMGLEHQKIDRGSRKANQKPSSVLHSYTQQLCIDHSYHITKMKV